MYRWSTHSQTRAPPSVPWWRADVRSGSWLRENVRAQKARRIVFSIVLSRQPSPVLFFKSARRQRQHKAPRLPPRVASPCSPSARQWGAVVARYLASDRPLLHDIGSCHPGLIHFLLNFVDQTCRCRAPAMILAMPIDAYRTEVLTRFGLAHAGLRSF